MSAANVLQFMTDSDMAIFRCDAKRQLGVDSWPKDSVTSDDQKK